MALGRMADKLLGRQQGESSSCDQERASGMGSHQLHSILQQTPHLLQQQHSKWIVQASIFLKETVGFLEKTKPFVQN